MMYCERCNIDFSEGLRYCKWCGQTLFERRRQTNELKTCPTCSVAIKPGWGFCKSCGGRLDGEAREVFNASCPRCGTMNDHSAKVCALCGEDLTHAHAEAPEQASTSFMAGCSSCGESIDPGSAYCKACGSPVYAEPGPFGDSAMLCEACNSYSPVGSTHCRVCNASLLPEAASGAAEPPSGEDKPSTLPDLAEHLPEGQAEPREATMQFVSPAAEIESGAHTIVFGESGDLAGAADDVSTDQMPTAAVVEPKPGAKTSVLSGVAGSKSELPPPTAAFKKTRITSPVEGEAGSKKPSTGETDAGSTSAAPPPEKLPSENLPPPFVTRVDLDRFDLGEKAASGQAGDRPAGERTIIFGSESTAPPAFQPDAAAAADLQEKPAETTDKAGTAAFNKVDEPPASEPGTREYSAPVVTAPPAPDLTPAPVQAASTAAPEYAQGNAAAAVEGAGKGKSAPVILSTIVALLIVGGAAYAVWWYALGGKPTPQPKPAEQPVAEQPAAPSTPTRPATPAAPEGMVLVEGGDYTIGRDDGDDIERPAHTVRLAPFYIDRTEVTNAEYKKFIDATGHKTPANWANGTYPEGRGSHPVTGVTWQDATDYAAWAGKRLPTEEEWEAAARGKNGYRYPWGNDWASSLANIGGADDSPADDKYSESINEVGRFTQGASPAGALDMIGNVWEWTASRLELYPESTAQLPDLVKKSPETYRVMRGGAYDGNNRHNSSYRGFLQADRAFPKVGFRCAKDGGR